MVATPVSFFFSPDEDKPVAPQVSMEDAPIVAAMFMLSHPEILDEWLVSQGLSFEDSLLPWIMQQRRRWLSARAVSGLQANFPALRTRVYGEGCKRGVSVTASWEAKS